MRFFGCFVFALLFFGEAVVGENITEAYMIERDMLVGVEEELQLGGNAVPNEKWVAVNKWIKSQVEAARPYVIEQNFRDIIPFIKNTKLYSVLVDMPKGALLHTHTLVDMEFVVSTATYRPDCYVDLREESESFGFFIYSNNTVKGFTNTVEARKASSNVTSFDEMLYNFTQFFTPPFSVSETEMWQQFDMSISRGGSLLEAEAVLRAATIDGMEKLEKENMQHVELRLVYHPSRLAKLYSALEGYKGNVTIQVIMNNVRSVNTSVAYDTMVQVLETQHAGLPYSDLIVGYDLVDEEDR